MIKLLTNALRTLCNRAIKGGLVKVEELVQVMYLWDYKRKKKNSKKEQKASYDCCNDSSIKITNIVNGLNPGVSVVHIV